MPARLKSWGLFRRRSDTLAVAAGVVTFVVGALALGTGNSAVGFMLCGVSLALRSLPPRVRIRKSHARMIAALALAIGALTLAEHFLGANFGIDARLFAGATRMPFGAALCLTLAATALVAVPRRAADWCAISVSVISLMSLAGYVYSL